jgi:hypothetical protein
MRSKLSTLVVLILSGLAMGQSVSMPMPSLQGKSARLKLISAISSKLPRDSRFQARLDEPLELVGQVLLPQGTVFEGHVEPTRARRMIRSGSLRLVFDRMVLPDGTHWPANLALTSVQYQKVKTDAEGTIRPKRSKKRLLFQIGGALLIAKVADDISEVAAASVTKGFARVIGFGAAAGFVLLQKGGEVKVPEGTDIEVMFGRDSELLPMGLTASPQPDIPHQ